MDSTTSLFFELIKISLKNKSELEHLPSEKQWEMLYELGCKQSLTGVLLYGIERLPVTQRPPQELLLKWIGIQQIVVSINKVQDGRSKELYEWFKKQGCDSCIIKGQGVARLYPQPELRQAGDIDIWVNADRDDVVRKMLSESIVVSVIDYVNCHAVFFDDVEVEVHFRPTYFFNPFANRRLQEWIQQNKTLQMTSFDDAVGFCYPTIAFNLVFSLIHIYRHVFSEGIGLRQLMDYYYILKHSTEVERKEAFDTLCHLGLGKFVASVMYVQRVVFNIDERLFLYQPNEKEGKILLNVILRGGNFGKYDERNHFVPNEQKWKRGMNSLKRDVRFLAHYPGEVLWMPLWKTWHWGWRKWNGYL